MKSARVFDVLWKRDYLAPSLSAGRTEYVHALQVLAEILGGGPESRLHQSLIAHKGLAPQVSTHYEPGAIDLATFAIAVTLRRDADVSEVAKTVELEVQALMSDAVPPAALAHAKEDIKRRVVFSEERMPAAARLIGEGLTRGRTLEDVKNWPRHIDAVTSEQLQAAARIVFGRSHSVTGVLRGTGRR